MIAFCVKVLHKRANKLVLSQKLQNSRHPEPPAFPDRLRPRPGALSLQHQGRPLRAAQPRRGPAHDPRDPRGGPPQVPRHGPAPEQHRQRPAGQPGPLERHLDQLAGLRPAGVPTRARRRRQQEPDRGSEGQDARHRYRRHSHPPGTGGAVYFHAHRVEVQQEVRRAQEEAAAGGVQEFQVSGASIFCFFGFTGVLEFFYGVLFCDGELYVCGREDWDFGVVSYILYGL